MSPNKTKLVFTLMRHVLKSLSFIEKTFVSQVTSTEDYCFDSKPVNSHIIVHLKTNLVAIELNNQLKVFELDSIISGNTLKIGVTHVQRKNSVITEKIGPIEPIQSVVTTSAKTESKVVPLSDITKMLREKGYDCGSKTRVKNYWVIYFSNEAEAKQALDHVVEQFPWLAGKLIVTAGQKSLKIHENLVSTLPRKAALSATKVAIKKSDGSQVELTQSINSAVTKFIVAQTGECEAKITQKLKNYYHLFPKHKDAVLEIPAKQFYEKIVTSEGLIKIPIALIIKHLKVEE